MSTGEPFRKRNSRLALGAGGLCLLLALLALAVLRVGTSGAGSYTGPEETGDARLDPATLDAAEAEVRRAVEEGAFPGAALAVGIGPRVERAVGVGRIGWSAAAAPVSPDTTLYDLASLTKAVATTTAVLLLAEDGRIDLDAPVQRWLPEFEGQFKDRVTWRHLLTHTSGLPGGAVIRGDEPEERLRRLLRTRIDAPPGNSAEYTDLGFLALWAAAERAAGGPLERFLEHRAWEPLGMHHTRFAPGEGCTACAPTLRLRDGTPYRGRPHDLYARRLGGTTGSAGLFATASDLARFAAMIANGGELGGERILQPETVRGILHQQPGAGRRTLGWRAFCPDEVPRESAACTEPVAIGHTGYTGTSLWIDPQTGAWMVLLSNRTYDVRNPEAVEAIGELRRSIWAEVLEGAGSER